MPKPRSSRKNFHQWKAGTINIRTGSEDWRLEEAVRQIDRSGLTICALQEVRKLEQGNTIIKVANSKYEIHWCGRKRLRRDGVALVIRIDPRIIIREISYISPRLISASIEVYGCKTKVIAIYAPTEESTESSKDSFYHQLCKHLTTNKNEKLIVLGDFNATTNAVKNHACVRSSSILYDIESNDNGVRMIDFARENKLSIMNTWFKHPQIHQFTWYSNDAHGTKKTLDYLLCSDWLRQYISDCRVRTSFDFNSDHKLLVTTLRTPKSKVARFITRKAKKKKKLDLELFMNDEIIQQNFVNNLEERFSQLDDFDSIDKMDAELIRHLKEASDSHIPKVDSTHNSPPWRNDPELRNLLEKRDKARQSDDSKDLIKRLSRQILNRHKTLKNEFFKAEAAQINIHAINRQVSKLFTKAKAQSTTLKSPPSSCPPEKLISHFTNHFNPPIPQEDELPPELMSDIPDFVNDLRELSRQYPFDNDIPTREEVVKSLSNLKNGKASNDIPPEILKHARNSSNFMDFFMKLVERVWVEKTVPETWGNGKIEALWKGKGSKSDPAMYRGLNIGSIVCKTVINIILSRLQSWYDHQLTDNQYGFRQNRGTNDATFVTKRFQQISNDQTTTGYLLFVDLSAAFDHIARSWLWKSIRLRLPPELENTTLIDILQNLYSKTTINIESKTVPTTAGVRQGGPESPPLFDLYIDYVMRIFMKHADDASLEFFKFKYRIPSTRTDRVRAERVPTSGISQLDWAGYADDIVLYLLTLASLQSSLCLIDSIFKRFRLKVNPTKTETMTTNRKYSYEDNSYPKSVITLDGSPIKNVENFRYLGCQIVHDQNTTGDWEVNSRIESAKNKFSSMRNVFLNHDVHLQTRLTFLRAYVRMRLTFNCQSWALTAIQLNRIDATWRLFLRKMIRNGFRRKNPEDEHDYKLYYSNNDLHRICKTRDVSEFIQTQQRNYAAHLVRGENSLLTKKLLFQDDKCSKRGRNTNTLLKQVLKNFGLDKQTFVNKAIKREF